jgi:hypothetical protein
VHCLRQQLDMVEMGKEPMAETDIELIDSLAKRHSVSPAAVQVVMKALRRGGGRMAQFSHADFGGMSQWSPGMSMVGDMFNTELKSKLEQSESAGSNRRVASDGVSYRSSGSTDWWPTGLGRPGAVGAQNDMRYAFFPESRRLVIDDHGAISIYDTGSHRIFGVAQAQSNDQTLSFTGQDGLVRVADLRRADG